MVKKWFIASLKYLPPFFLALIPLTMIYGALSPWPVSQEVLSKYDDNLVLLIGFNSRSGITGGNTYNQKSKTYLIVNDSLKSKTVTVFAEFDKYQRVKEKEGGLLMVVLWYLVFIAISWYFWIKPITKQSEQ